MVLYCTVTVFALSTIVTSNVAVTPSVTVCASAIDSTGASVSSSIRAVAVAVPTVAFSGLLSVTVNVSPSSSSSSSVLVTTSIVFASSPAANVKVPLADV